MSRQGTRLDVKKVVSIYYVLIYEPVSINLILKCIFNHKFKSNS